MIIIKTFFASCPIGKWGPRRDLNANLIICLLAKMNDIMMRIAPRNAQIT